MYAACWFTYFEHRDFNTEPFPEIIVIAWFIAVTESLTIELVYKYPHRERGR